MDGLAAFAAAPPELEHWAELEMAAVNRFASFKAQLVRYGFSLHVLTSYYLSRIANHEPAKISNNLLQTSPSCSTVPYNELMISKYVIRLLQGTAGMLRFMSKHHVATGVVSFSCSHGTRSSPLVPLLMPLRYVHYHAV